MEITRVPSGFLLEQCAENRKKVPLKGTKKMMGSILGHTEFEGTLL